MKSMKEVEKEAILDQALNSKIEIGMLTIVTIETETGVNTQIRILKRKEKENVREIAIAKEEGLVS